jgi:hypothetical protein
LRKFFKELVSILGKISSVVAPSVVKMEMNNEPPRRQERQELSFSIKRENKIIPQIYNAKIVRIFKIVDWSLVDYKRLLSKANSFLPGGYTDAHR